MGDRAQKEPLTKDGEEEAGESEKEREGLMLTVIRRATRGLRPVMNASSADNCISAVSTLFL